MDPTQLSKMFTSGKFTDVTLVVKGEAVKAHRVLLACWSPVFQKLFEDNPDQNTFEIDHSFEEKVCFKEMIKFFYSASAELPNRLNHLSEYLAVAHRWEVQALKEAIGLGIAKMLSTDNLLSVLDIAETYNITALRQEAALFLCANFNFALEKSRYLKLSITTFAELLTKDELPMTQEEHLLELAVDFIFSKGETQAEIDSLKKQLLPLLRFPLMSAPTLAERVELDRRLACPLLDQILFESYRYHALQAEVLHPAAPSVCSTTPRKGYLRFVRNHYSGGQTYSPNLQRVETASNSYWHTFKVSRELLPKTGRHEICIKLIEGESNVVLGFVPKDESLKALNDSGGTYVGSNSHEYAWWANSQGLYKGGHHTQYGEYAKSGDVVGAVWDSESGDISFTLNGSNQGIAWPAIGLKTGLLFVVSLCGSAAQLQDDFEKLIAPIRQRNLEASGIAPVKKVAAKGK